MRSSGGGPESLSDWTVSAMRTTLPTGLVRFDILQKSFESTMGLAMDADKLDGDCLFQFGYPNAPASPATPHGSTQRKHELGLMPAMGSVYRIR